ncbi:hypothetical protein BVY01_00895 [bacterium I07]|nr:hypothetical protein BVY01_00895 [bacterium I07]
MRKLIVGLMVLMLVIGCQQTGEKPVDVEAEKAAIKELIVTAWTEANNNKNFENWANTVLHDNKVLSVNVGKTGQGEDAGWDKIGPDWKKYMDDNPEPATGTYVFEKFTFRIWREAAFAAFDWYRKEDKEKDPDRIPFRSYCVFEKTIVGWKFATWIGINRNSYRETTTE